MRLVLINIVAAANLVQVIYLVEFGRILLSLISQGFLRLPLTQLTNVLLSTHLEVHWLLEHGGRDQPLHIIVFQRLRYVSVLASSPFHAALNRVDSYE